jgi:hypothetical protein
MRDRQKDRQTDRKSDILIRRQSDSKRDRYTIVK